MLAVSIKLNGTSKISSPFGGVREVEAGTEEELLNMVRKIRENASLSD